MTVKNRMDGPILTAMYKVVLPRAEMAVRSITGSSGHGPLSVVQNPNRRAFTENTENTPLMSASSRLDLNSDQDRIDEARDIENFEDGDFLALKPNYDRRAHTHHSYFEFFTQCFVRKICDFALQIRSQLVFITLLPVRGTNSRVNLHFTFNNFCRRDQNRTVVDISLGFYTINSSVRPEQKSVERKLLNFPNEQSWVQKNDLGNSNILNTHNDKSVAVSKTYVSFRNFLGYLDSVDKFWKQCSLVKSHSTNNTAIWKLYRYHGKAMLGHVHYSCCSN